MKKTFFHHYKLSHMWWHTTEGDGFHRHTTKEFDIQFSKIHKGIALPLYVRWCRYKESYLVEHRLLIGFLFWSVAFTKTKYDKDVEVIC